MCSSFGRKDIQNKAVGKNKLKNRLNKFATWIVERYIAKSGKKYQELFSKQRIRELSYLNPGKDVFLLVKEYYAGKIEKVIMVLLIGVWLIALITILGLTQNTISDENTIKRNEYGGGSRFVKLNVKTEDADYGVIELKISEQGIGKATEEENADLTYKKLLDVVLGDNLSFEKIDGDMNLVTEIEDFPFEIRWESSNPIIMDERGKHGEREIGNNGEEVLLKAILSYGKNEYVYDFPIVVYSYKRSDEENIALDIDKRLKAIDENTVLSEEFRLPNDIYGKRLEWREVREPVVLMIAAILLCTLAGIWGGMDKDLEDKYKERNYILLAEYAEFVSKLQIFLSAGMTIRGSLERIYRDYNKKHMGIKDVKNYLYEELGLCIKRLNDGAGEAECYERLGNRCGLSCYKKLSSLLCQNLRRGNSGIVSALQNEVDTAFEDRKLLVRKRGEEAKTKLILPMMMLLGVVMIIIMVPAYLSFGGM